MSRESVKRKIDRENRSYKENWVSDYLIVNNNGKLQFKLLQCPRNIISEDITQQCMQISMPQTHSLYASYVVSLELSRAKKSFTDGNLIKKCAIEMAKAFEDSKIAEKFELVLSHQTIQRRIVERVSN
ncbi:hypothetical protein WA026_010312 [Henosepilachna vigintioctopunctata]|uniref:Transposase n=1 Tax=Henosepilachna vigintioctopunctata TaxID=420089 RepID=A0AAW1V3G7_9CUCU